MRRVRVLIASAWTLAALAGLASIWGWSTALPSVPREHRKPYPPAPPITPGDTVGLADAAAAIRDRDPFRSERKPTRLRFNPWQPAVAATQSPAPTRPALSLAGVLGGPPWNALIQGIPGREGGVVLGVGEAAGGIRLTKIHGDTAFVSGSDTTWVLIPGRVVR